MMLAGERIGVNDSSLVARLPTVSPRYGKLISRNASALLKGDDNRANRYFRLTICRAWACSSGGKIRARATRLSPVSFPRMVQGATSTSGLLRIRFTLPILLIVIT